MSDREEQLSAERAAIDACRSGLSIRKSAALYGLKPGTLFDRLRGRHKVGLQSRSEGRSTRGPGGCHSGLAAALQRRPSLRYQTTSGYQRLPSQNQHSKSIQGKHVSPYLTGTGDLGGGGGRWFIA